MRERVKILVVDDEEIVRESLSGWSEEDGYGVGVAPDGPSAIEKLKGNEWNILLVDLKMPGMDGLQVLENARKVRPEAAIVIMTAYATVDTAVQAMKMGAYDYLVKPFEPEELSLMIKKLVNQQNLLRENILLRKALKRQYRFRDLVSKSPKMQGIFELVKTAAKSNSTVLILGESGTGKELLARAIHAESPRCTGPFVEVSCAALTETLLESELFGHEKGAFTDAVSRKKGKFEMAHGGTLFLDEIGDISPKLQLDLLRVIEEREFRRVGGSELIKVDVRIIAATNRNLKKLVEEGIFREDLYYRLNVIAITLPPLRERKEDIPLLVEHFLGQLGVEMEKNLEGVSREAMDLLLSRDWPGNVRELRNVLERGAVVGSGGILQPGDLGLLGAEGDDGFEGAGGESLKEVERHHILEVLKQNRWNISRSARALGIDRVTLYHKIKRYGLKPERAVS
ncbi:MAG: sigma-54-dependent Fis family transcriptional regulator [Candidatus Tectomicrobia bacterium]|uniref:Sigma-54-dependent Fis family transcriptional regulator n=1 Tax=Tectimicrobiota bacterium TaxID=2528274 RepID=A0A932M1K3_UNCTE|nr:sigma-54-dependent Fis family transcriptional regulator [Candidatus Tectomicrobia bacterium]